MSIAISVQKKIADGRTDRHTDLSINYIGISINYIGTRANARRVIHVAAICIISSREKHFLKIWFNSE